MKPRERGSWHHKYNGGESERTSGPICSLMILWISFFSPTPSYSFSYYTPSLLPLCDCPVPSVPFCPSVFSPFLRNPTATDLQFARTSDGHPVPFATAGDCYSAAKCPQVCGGGGAPLTKDPHPTLPPGDPWLHPLLGIQLEELLWRAMCPPASTVSAMLRATNLGIPSVSQGTHQSYTPNFCIQQNAPIMVVKI